MSLQKSIAVFGGNGFLGRKICEVGVELGYKVGAFSRSGVAPSSAKGKWVEQVSWNSANIFDSKTYEEQLKEYDTVVHSIGILFENQSYKKSMNSNFDFLQDIQRLANTVKGGNPMDKNDYNTYGAIQRDSAVLLADSFLKVHDKGNYVYISADQAIPIVPEEYITTKREAEFELSYKPNLRTIVMRPGFMYDDSESHTNRDFLKSLLNLGYSTKELVIGDKIEFFNRLIRPPVSTEKVAWTIYEKLQDETFKGVVGLDEIVKNL